MKRGIENIVHLDRRRVLAHIMKDREVFGANYGCCASYATIRYEISAGFGNTSMNKIFKN